MSYTKLLSDIKNGLAPKTTGKKPKKPIPKKSAKKLAEEKEAKELLNGGETELQQWYADIMKKEPGKCWETGELINKKDKIGWHGSIAHVLPKEHFPSVATHPKNYMILKMWGGTHGRYDSNWMSAAKMNIWPYAVKIINLLYPQLTPEEKARIRESEIIAQEIKPETYNSK
jgi:hypothetical protein